MSAKRSMKTILILSLLAAAMCILLKTSGNVYAASSVKLSRSRLTVFVSDKQTLKVKGTSKKVTWSSSNEKVAKVSAKGKVRALKPGKATITAKVGKKRLKCKVTVYETIGTYYCLWNVNWNLSPSGRKLTEAEAAEVRRAVNLLIDRSYIAKSIVGEGRKPAVGLVARGIMEPDGGQFYKHSGPKNAGYYPVKAKKAAAMKILKKYYSVSGGKVTNFPEIDYIYNKEGAAHAAIASYIQSRLKRAGIKMNIKSYAWDDYLTELKKGHFTLARSGWAADVNDAINFLELYVKSNPDKSCRLGRGKHASESVYSVKLKGIGNYKNLKGTWKQTYQKLITYIKKEKKAKNRNRLLHKAEDQLMETGCICPLYYYT